MSSTTLSGAVKIAVWSASVRCMSAFMRDAMNSCVFGCIIRSCFATRYQDGTLFHSGRGAFSWMQATLIGRCTAANRTFSSVEAFCANADANPEFGHPDEAMWVRGELRCLRMGGLAIEDFRDGLPFVGCQGRYEHQPADAVVSGGADHRAGVGVSYQDDRAIGSFQGSVERPDIVREGGQWNWRGNGLHAPTLQKPDDPLPARPIGPGSMNHHNGRFPICSVHDTDLFRSCTRART